MDYGQGVQGFLGWINKQAASVIGVNDAGDKALFLKSSKLPGYAALMHIYQLGKLFLRDAGMFAYIYDIRILIAAYSQLFIWCGKDWRIAILRLRLS